MFIYKHWNMFCKQLAEENTYSISATKVLEEKQNNFLILKHDVETNPAKALVLARIEFKNGHKGVYYVQAYLLNKRKNIEILKKIKDLGHEVTYHHDVMDSNAGILSEADKCFRKNLEKFIKNGFEVRTVCQHGNPIIERKGYNSNRDFFRNENISYKYNNISEIMVNYKERLGVDYKYISDAGYGWKIIYDPENNDIIDSENKNIKLDDLQSVFETIKKENAVIVSTHPHRWYRNSVIAFIKNIIFKTIKTIAKLVIMLPFMKKIMGKFYFLAKKI